ncbi:MAG: TlpA disulfide reductase family protein [Bacteroidota bacterium]|nr:TlpA disulfide reductase family protein [Bacteroidota bacterium]
MMKNLLFFVLLIFVAGNSFGQDDEKASTLTKIGQDVPSFSFAQDNGQLLKIADYKGKVVLLNFFATWCGPCMLEMPKVESLLWQPLKTDKFMILAFGRKHSREEMDAFKKVKGFTFPIFPDPQASIYNLFASKYIPRNIVINKEGKIVFQSVGYSEEEFQKMVNIIKAQLK